MARRGLLLALLLSACAMPLGACSETAERPPTLVFAAASLTGPFEVIAREFERRHPGSRVDLHCAGTAQLVVQALEGAPADVLASADEASLERIVAAGLAASPPRRFARNRLAIVTAAGNPRGIAALSDLARDDLRVVLCGPEVPAGRYAREALARAGVGVRSASDEPSVKAVVSKVRLGEVDAGIVYATDVVRAEGVAAVAIDERFDVEATYPIAVLAGGADRAGGEAFVAFVLSPEGRAVLESFGFAGP